MKLFFLCLFVILSLSIAAKEGKKEVEVYFKIKDEDIVLKFPPKKEAADKMAKRVCLEKIKVFESKSDEKECIDAMEQYLDMKLQEFLGSTEDEEDDEEQKIDEEPEKEKEIKKSKLKIKKEEKKSSKTEEKKDKAEENPEDLAKLQETKKKLLTEVDVQHFTKGEGQDIELHIVLNVPEPENSNGEIEEAQHEIVFKPFQDDIKETTKNFCLNQLKKFYGDEVNQHFLTLCMAPLTVKIEKIWNFHSEKLGLTKEDEKEVKEKKEEL